jgi:ABC-type transport system involved in multi-copper enzyme maturation permease subunit
VKIYLIAKQTFAEIYESKVLLNVAFLGAFLFLVTYVVSEFSYGVANKVTLDIGLGTLSLSVVGIALFLGATLLQKEISSRTLYMIISRPVSRTSFLLGKLMGLAGILLVNVLVLFFILYGFYAALGGQFNYLISWALFYIYLESLIVMLIVVFFSLVSNNIIAVFVTLTLFASGHAVESVKDTMAYKVNPLIKAFVDYYSYVLPNFTKLNIKSFVLYERFIENSYLVTAFFYGFVWVGIFLGLSTIVFTKNEFS